MAELLVECGTLLKKIQAVNRDLAMQILRLQLQPMKEIIQTQERKYGHHHLSEV